MNTFYTELPMWKCAAFFNGSLNLATYHAYKKKPTDLFIWIQHEILYILFAILLSHACSISLRSSELHALTPWFDRWKLKAFEQSMLDNTKTS